MQQYVNAAAHSFKPLPSSCRNFNLLDALVGWSRAGNASLDHINWLASLTFGLQGQLLPPAAGCVLPPPGSGSPTRSPLGGAPGCRCPRTASQVGSLRGELAAMRSLACHQAALGCLRMQVRALSAWWYTESQGKQVSLGRQAGLQSPPPVPKATNYVAKVRPAG